MHLVCNRYSCVPSGGFYTQSMSTVSAPRFQQALKDTSRVGQINAGNKKLKNSVVCLAKGLCVCEVKAGGPLK